MGRLVSKIATEPRWLEMAAASAFGAAVCGLILYAGAPMIVLLYALCAGGALGIFAHRYPTVTVGAWVLLSLYTRELLGPGAVRVGTGIDLRYADPVIAAVAVALLYELAFGDKRAHDTLFKQYFCWTLLIGWLFFQIFRSIPQHGIVPSLGEFRTGYWNVLLLPYVIVFFRTRDQQWRLFRVLMVLSLLFIPVAVYHGVELRFRFAAYAKWLGSYANLALIWGALSLYVMQRQGLWRDRSLAFVALLFLTFALTLICGHRSIWLTAAVVVACLLWFGQISFSSLLKFSAGLLLAGLAIGQLYSGDIFNFLQERLTAFTSFENDPTASWRYDIWQDALQQSKAHLWAGKGFGSYFEFQIPDGRVVTTALHNQYIQLVYQVGVVGLALYLAFLLQVIRKLWRVYTETVAGRDYTITLVALVILAGASAYYVAYPFDPFTWLYVGLALAVAQSHFERDAVQQVPQYSILR